MLTVPRWTLLTETIEMNGPTAQAHGRAAVKTLGSSELPHQGLQSLELRRLTFTLRSRPVNSQILAP
jgi:hypothetical protein